MIELPGSQGRKGKRKGDKTLIAGEEEMNHVLTGDKSTLVINPEEDGSHGVVDGDS